MIINYPSITQFEQHVELKDYRQPTKDEYVRYVRKLAEHFQCDPATLTENQLRQYFLFLRQHKRYKDATMKGAKYSLLCFFVEHLKHKDWSVFRDVRVGKPQVLPIVLSRAEVQKLLSAVRDRTETLQLLANVQDIHGYPTRLLAHLLYACGLRVCEPLNLRIKDLDLKTRRLHIHQAKGNKGRILHFPECLSAALERQLVFAKSLHAQDLVKRTPVVLPGLLAKKFPYAEFANAGPGCFLPKSFVATHARTSWSVGVVTSPMFSVQ